MSQTELPTPEYVANLIYPVGSVLLLESSKTPNGVGIPFTWERRRFSLINWENGMSLDVAQASHNAGANVDVYPTNWTNAQLWRFTTTVDGKNELRAKLDMWVRVA
jgi:hypothetical protein